MCNDTFVNSEINIKLEPVAVMLKLYHFDDDDEKLCSSDISLEYDLNIIIPICSEEDTNASIEAISKLLNLSYPDKLHMFNFVFTFLDYKKKGIEIEDKLFFHTDDEMWYCSSISAELLYSVDFPNTYPASLHTA